MSFTAKINNTIQFDIDGSLDALAVEILRPNFDALVQNKSDVSLNLTSVPFIDSSGIGAIVFLFKRLRALDRNLKLIGVHGQPLELLKHLRIDQSISVMS